MWSMKILLALLLTGVFTSIVADSNNLAQRFLDRVNRSIASKNPKVTAELFQPGFIFYGCNGTYDKEKSVEILTHLPAGSNFSSTLKSSEHVGYELINYTVEISGFKTHFPAEFLLNQTSQQLIVGGSVSECEKPRVARNILVALIFYPPFFINRIVNHFFDRAKRVIRLYDKEGIENLFDDKFIFKGCRVILDKTTSVQTIRRYVGSKQFNHEIIFSMDLNGYDVGIVANIFGLLEDFGAKIILDSYKHKLTSVEVLNCPGTPIIKGRYWEVFEKDS
ncbi:hypothetical protein CAEBREN_06685 [Caenorhabditis brenneri]|uniref:NTF2-like domain-containing protein n=1 Tax=Caenorhabditis brenneri TaxID=135651 RepID=G0MNY4_CAEBE|nr:hypothetical protein CAEBREN_06685 [Caenorhabditis brenneri]